MSDDRDRPLRRTPMHLFVGIIRHDEIAGAEIPHINPLGLREHRDSQPSPCVWPSRLTDTQVAPPPYIWPSRLTDYHQWIDIPLRSVLPPVEVIIPPHHPQS